MAATAKIEVLGLRAVQTVMFAVGDLVRAIDCADPMLVTDEILEKTEDLREAMKVLR